MFEPPIQITLEQSYDTLNQRLLNPQERSDVCQATKKETLTLSLPHTKQIRSPILSCQLKPVKNSDSAQLTAQFSMTQQAKILFFTTLAILSTLPFALLYWFQPNISPDLFNTLCFIGIPSHILISGLILSILYRLYTLKQRSHLMDALAKILLSTP